MGSTAYHSCVAILLAWQLCISEYGAVHARGRSPANTKTANSTFDYIVVGGGNAGLTIASRLAGRPSLRVAIVEAGDFPETTTGNQSQIPAYDVFYNGKDPSNTGPTDWGFITTPQAVSLFIGFSVIIAVAHFSAGYRQPSRALYTWEGGMTPLTLCMSS